MKVCFLDFIMSGMSRDSQDLIVRLTLRVWAQHCVGWVCVMLWFGEGMLPLVEWKLLQNIEVYGIEESHEEWLRGWNMLHFTLHPVCSRTRRVIAQTSCARNPPSVRSNGTPASYLLLCTWEGADYRGLPSIGKTQPWHCVHCQCQVLHCHPTPPRWACGWATERRWKGKDKSHITTVQQHFGVYFPVDSCCFARKNVRTHSHHHFKY